MEGDYKKLDDLEVPHCCSSMLEVQPVKMIFRGIWFSVKVKKDGKEKTLELLKGMCGGFLPGELIAVMGPSGAGKTTLVNFLAGISTRGFEGEVWLNGQPRDSNHCKIQRKLSRIVMQDDFLLPTLTVEETMRFAAELQLPRDMSVKEKMCRVDNVLLQLGLEHTKHTLVGSADTEKGLSGGQRKRLSIATELIAHPSIMFLDEPTSGLDSSTAVSVVHTLHQIAQKTLCTIICSIHQPSAKIFDVFDKLILLDKGELAYFGETSDVVSTLSNLGLQCPQYTNPADFIMESVCEEDGRDRMVQYVKETQPCRTVLENAPNYPKLYVDLSEGWYAASQFQQFKLLLHRALISSLRNKLVTHVRAGAHVVMALMTGLLYFQINNTQNHIQDRMSSLFMSMLMLHMLSILPTVLTFPIEAVYFRNEHSNSHFGVLPYFLAKVTSDLPYLILLPVTFGIITYFLVGYPVSFEKVSIYLSVMVLHSFTGQAFGFICSAVSPNVIVAVLLTPLVTIPPYMFIGFFIKLNNIPVWFRWLQWISPVKYPFVALVRNAFEGLTLRCTESQRIPPDGRCPITSGDQVLENEGMNHSYDRIWIDIVVLVGFILMFNIVSYILLRIRTKRKK